MSDESFSRHPVVTLVVWLLGGKTLRSNESSVTWKDDHGGDIAEVMDDSKMQFTDVYGIREDDSSKENLDKKSPTSATSDTDVDENNHGDEDQGWDWYVAITPPKQEFYPRGTTQTKAS
mmetsp:Transcript_27836/g.28083  ORF Transcript_27836/g.28083 Transcript_27836/m.28083 type:complete len:119 (+) Transcript_27836:76-432(+)|eukprot:CAMPEP_0182428460 /NCGR_PEP_ID=MMETSP1167-20130531/23047_1 /TAXON_ID=2988 /ORGANISM="Mallomonas Sp, Strain CCMP3275" /LENGTH=118 /DNA_ID=CAMNT_0024611395 /DNA_START=60 /DNA_END=416 /DNA_ORIENTATION=-